MSRRACFVILSFLSCSIASADWIRTSGPEGGSIRAIAVGQTAALAATYQGEIYRSNWRITGGTWMPVSSLPATRIVAAGDVFLAVTQTGLFSSADNGLSWVQRLSGASFTPPALTVDQGVAYVCLNDTIFRSFDRGVNWTFVNHIMNITGNILATGDTILIGSSVGMGVQRSTDGGTTFNTVTTGVPFSGIVNSMARLGSEFFASFGNDGVFRSMDGGLSWEQRSTGLPQYDVNSYHPTTRMHVLNATLYAVANTKVHRYDGSTWSPLPLDMMVFDIDGGSDGSHSALLGGTSAGIWRSTDAGTSWSESNHELVATSAKMFATVGNQVFTLIANRIARTTDNGITWTYPGKIEANRLVAQGASLFAATGGGVSSSTDNGATWGFVNQGITEYLPDLRDISATSGAVFASFYYIHSFHGHSSWFSGGVFRSTNNGASWVAVNNGLPQNGFSVVAPTHRVAANGQVLFAATVAGVYRSLNAGASWSPAGTGIPSGTWVETLYNSPAFVLFGSNRGIFKFNGNAWEEMNTGLPQPNGYYPYAHGFVESEGTLYAATSAGVFRFDGTSWSRLGSGEPSTSAALSIIEMNCDLLAAVSTKGVWKYSFAPLTVDGNSALPREFQLTQNYPNPFNPSTTIRFSTRTAGRTSLRVFDLLGREVAALVDGQLQPGHHTVEWDATNHSSGVYIATLSSRGFSASRKMILSK